MKIKKHKGQGGSPLIFIAIIAILLISVMALLKEKDEVSLASPDPTELTDLFSETKIRQVRSYKSILDSVYKGIYEDSTLSIYIVKQYAVPHLVYIYPDSLNERQAADRFFVHVYLKDNSKIVQDQTTKFLNFGFVPRRPFEEIEVDGRKYIVFKRKLVHDNYLGRVLELDNVDYINTGRFQQDLGRSFQRSKLKIPDEATIEIKNNFQRQVIRISDKNFSQLKEYREEAVKNGVIGSEQKQLLPARITDPATGQEIKVDIRLKGDWTDHVVDEKKWSLRVVMDEEKTIKGMRKFSFQHPKVRNYAWEWLFQKAVKREGLIGIRYDFVDLTLKVGAKDQSREIPIGIMAAEEAFDKILLENNRRREGVILAFDESYYWKDIEQKIDLGLEEIKNQNGEFLIDSSPIRLYNENKVLQDPNLMRQFETAKNLLDGFRQKKLKVSEAFDIDRLTSYVALLNLFGGLHGLGFINLKFYYNPITGKLEPIAFDSNSGNKISDVVNFHLSGSDDLYREKLAEKLRYFSSTDYINSLIDDHSEELQEILINLNTEFNTGLDTSILEFNSNMIKRYINPSTSLLNDFESFDGKSMALKVFNKTDFDITITGLQHQDGKLLDVLKEDLYISPGETKLLNFELKDAFVNAFVSKKNKKSEFRYPKDVAKLRVTYLINGIDLERKSEVRPYGWNKDLDASVSDIKEARSSNMEEFDFLLVDSSTGIVRIGPGDHRVDHTVIIPENFEVQIEKGANIDLINHASFLSHSPIFSLGTGDSPITFYSSDGTGGGVFINKAHKRSLVEHTTFSNLSNPSDAHWEVSGAVNFHESDVSISQSVFKDNRCEDALNIIRSNFSMDGSLFENTWSDAFDGDFVEGTITNSEFNSAGNDGIDVSGSSIYLENITINNPSDKGVSAGEASNMKGTNIRVKGGEIGIVSKDLSTIEFSDVYISETRLGFSAFQKKPEFGIGKITINDLFMSDTESDHLVESGSELTIDDVRMSTVSNRVIEQMYGKEYGKSSK
ncbi:right-handed parallel beta-helix repeat-containing protein [Aureitalea marina]|uniref:Right handed beta helix domain-containing protein n=1 Tax=Aureitalea marina TaxID=930804 RepID=A0A2S7KLX0_9FLAO|nr:right-handed parallel beta-helix repeat-containing protein [Aureitalea marina]PQB03598.1 hypothetical protein BST85_00800 [Aureitalea marina]